MRGLALLFVMPLGHAAQHLFSCMSQMCSLSCVCCTRNSPTICRWLSCLSEYLAIFFDHVHSRKRKNESKRLEGYYLLHRRTIHHL
ncbi:hypothetical protein BJ912DRAFT_964659, partial [Pholiota molesta]